jgi:putative transposase
MESLFEVAGISRQAFHQWLLPSEREQNRTSEEQVLAMARQLRREFLPGAGGRVLYFFLRNKHPQFDSMLSGWGKHQFEALCLANGMRIESRRFVPKTTVRGDFVFPNLIEGMKINDINQIWVSDICYLYSACGKLLGYATTLMDLYSRQLLGLSFSVTMRAVDTAQAVINQAFECRKTACFDQLIFHSDGGKQYIETHFVQALRSRNIQSSMAENCYENSFAEALNDTLKNHLLHDAKLNSFAQLKKLETFIKYGYNHYKPHSALNRRTPIEFEQHLLNLQPCQRTILEITTIQKNNPLKT